MSACSILGFLMQMSISWLMRTQICWHTRSTCRMSGGHLLAGQSELLTAMSSEGQLYCSKVCA